MRRDDDGELPAGGRKKPGSRCDDPAGGSPASVSAEAPSSRPAVSRETSNAEADEKRKRLYFLHRWPSKRSMQRMRQRVKELAPNSRCHADLRDVIGELNPVLRGWGQYFRTGNAAKHFIQIDDYVVSRLRTLCVKRKGRNLRPTESEKWTREYFENLGLYRLRGTVRFPERPFWEQKGSVMQRSERSPVSRVPEIGTHGLNGGLASTRRETGRS